MHIAWRVALGGGRSSRRVGSDAPERADARPYSICRGGRSPPRRVYLGRCPERQAGSHLDSERFGSRADRGRSTKAARQQGPGAGCFYAELGIVRRSAAELSLTKCYCLGPSATCRRSRFIAGLASLCRRSGRRAGDRPFRCVGAG